MNALIAKEWDTLLDFADNPQSSQYKGDQRYTVQRPQQINHHMGPHVNS